VPNENNISRRGLAHETGNSLQWLVAITLARTHRTISSFVGYERTRISLPVLGALGRVSEFPEGETRLATFRNPYVTPTDADRRHCLLGSPR